LQDASRAALNKIEIVGPGLDIYFPKLDVDITFRACCRGISARRNGPLRSWERRGQRQEQGQGGGGAGKRQAGREAAQGGDNRGAEGVDRFRLMWYCLRRSLV
jgi:hypothetical protein